MEESTTGNKLLSGSDNGVEKGGMPVTFEVFEKAPPTPTRSAPLDYFPYAIDIDDFSNHFLVLKGYGGNNDTTGAWQVFFFTIMGVLFPPTSLLVMFVFVNDWRRAP